MNAWKQVKSNGSVGGIDGLSLCTFETDLENNLREIIEGKLTNQLNLVKYFNKYHKSRGEEYIKREQNLAEVVDRFKKFISMKNYSDCNFLKDLMGFEAQLISIREQISKMIDPRQDKIVYYRMCLNCYTKIIYQPEHLRKEPKLSGIV